MYRQYPFSEQKQREAKAKVKETDPTRSQILFFPVTKGNAEVASGDVVFSLYIFTFQHFVIVFLS